MYRQRYSSKEIIIANERYSVVPSRCDQNLNLEISRLFFLNQPTDHCLMASSLLLPSYLLIKAPNVVLETAVYAQTCLVVWHAKHANYFADGHISAISCQLRILQLRKKSITSPSTLFNSCVIHFLHGKTRVIVASLQFAGTSKMHLFSARQRHSSRHKLYTLNLPYLTDS